MTRASCGTSRGVVAPGDPVRRLVARIPIYVELDTTLRTAAELMAHESIGAVLVRGPHGPRRDPLRARHRHRAGRGVRPRRRPSP
jgi:CBS domain-containing protein